MASIFELKNLAGTSMFAVDDSGNVTAAGTISTTGIDDFGAGGIKADVIAESTAAAGVTADGVLLKDNSVTVGTAGQVVTDIIAEKTAAAGVTVDGVLLKDNSVTVGTAGSVSTDTIAEKTAAAGVTVDGCLIKDGRAAALATASIFYSVELTGSGGAQNTPHGFGSTPTLAFAVFTELDGNAADIAPGTHDPTVCIFTVTAGQKYKIVAFK